MNKAKDNQSNSVKYPLPATRCDEYTPPQPAQRCTLPLGHDSVHFVEDVVPVQAELEALLARWTEPCVTDCEHAHCPLLRELRDIVEPARISAALEKARQVVKPLVDREKEGEWVGDIMEMRLNAAAPETSDQQAAMLDAIRSNAKWWDELPHFLGGQINHFQRVTIHARKQFCDTFTAPLVTGETGDKDKESDRVNETRNSVIPTGTVVKDNSGSAGQTKSDITRVIEWLEHRCDYGPPCGKCIYCRIARTIPWFDSGNTYASTAPEASSPELVSESTRSGTAIEKLSREAARKIVDMDVCGDFDAADPHNEKAIAATIVNIFSGTAIHSGAADTFTLHEALKMVNRKTPKQLEPNVNAHYQVLLSGREITDIREALALAASPRDEGEQAV